MDCMQNKSFKHKLRAEERIAQRLQQIMQDLNSKNALLLVEGKNDQAAVRGLGYTGAVFQMCGSGGGTKRLAIATQEYNKIIVLFDLDKRGERLEKTIKSKINYAGITIDYSTRIRIKSIAGGVSHIEDLIKFAGYLKGMQGSFS